MHFITCKNFGDFQKMVSSLLKMKVTSVARGEHSKPILTLENFDLHTFLTYVFIRSN